MKAWIDTAGSKAWKSGRRAIHACLMTWTLVAAGGVLQAPQAHAVLHRVPLPEDCAHAAAQRLGMTLLPEGTAVRRELPDREGAATGRYIFYVDIASVQTRMPLRLRMYCTVDAAGRVESLSTLPRMRGSRS